MDARFLLLAALLAIAGCSATQSAQQEEEIQADARYVRRIAPFPVLGADGAPYEFPFLGGFDVPRPQIADIDQDGDADLFVQERSDELMFFENTGSPASAGAGSSGTGSGTADSTRLVWRADQYKGLAVGDWYRFVDLTGDGALDLLAEEPYSYVRYYRNTGPAGKPAFELVEDTLKTVAGEPLFSDRQNIPNVTDIDCDGLPDLFVGRLDGTITRYEVAEGSGGDGVPRFRLVTERFEDIEIVAQVSQPGTDAPPERPVPGQQPVPGQPPLPGNGPSAPLPAGSARHGANTMAFADVEGDGDLDLLWGDYFEPGLLLLRNTGSCENPNFRTDPVPFPPGNPVSTSGYNAPAVGDLTGDGRRDLLVGVIGGAYNPDRTTRDNLYFYEQTPDGAYRLRTRRYLRAIDVGSESAPAFGDLDADGDLDLLVGNKIATDGSRTGRVVRFENVGTPAAPAYRLRDTLALPEAYNYAPALADLDADGDLDLVTGTWNEGLRFHRNGGTSQTPQFDAEGSALVELTRGSHTTPALADLDDDGDLDLLIGETSGTLNFYRNTGTPQAPQFDLVSDEYGGIDVGRRSAPAFHDADGDGDLDLLVGSEGDGLAFFRNTGTPAQPQFERDAGPFAFSVPGLAAPAFHDVDGDDDQDLIMGTAAGGLLFFEDRGER